MYGEAYSTSSLRGREHTFKLQLHTMQKASHDQWRRKGFLIGGGTVCNYT